MVFLMMGNGALAEKCDAADVNAFRDEFQI